MYSFSHSSGGKNSEISITGPKWGVGRAMLPLEALGGRLSSPLPTAAGCWHSLACGHLTAVFASSSPEYVISLYLSLTMTLAMAFRAHIDNPE